MNAGGTCILQALPLVPSLHSLLCYDAASAACVANTQALRATAASNCCGCVLYEPVRSAQCRVR